MSTGKGHSNTQYTSVCITCTSFNCSVCIQHLQNLTHPAWLGSVPSGPSHTVCMDTDGDLGLFDPSAVWGPVVACQTQEIPLLLLHSSVVATCLCVYFGGAIPVSVCQSQSPFFRRGLTVMQIRQDRGPRGRTQGQLNKHNHGLFLRTLCLPIGRLPGSLFFFFFYFICPLTSPHSTFEAGEVWPLNSDLAGKAEPFLKGPCKKWGSSVEFLDWGLLNLSAAVLSNQVMNLVGYFSHQ